MKTQDNLIPLADAHAFVGVSERDFWQGVGMAGVQEVFAGLHKRPFFKKTDLEKVAIAVKDIKPKKEKIIYIVRMGTRGHFKIGIAGDHVRRLMELQVSSPFRLQVEHTESGGHALERRAHRALSEYRTTGEWFAPHRDVITFVRHTQQHGILSALTQREHLLTGKLAGK